MKRVMKRVVISGQEQEERVVWNNNVVVARVRQTSVEVRNEGNIVAVGFMFFWVKKVKKNG